MRNQDRESADEKQYLEYRAKGTIGSNWFARGTPATAIDGGLAVAISEFHLATDRSTMKR